MNGGERRRDAAAMADGFSEVLPVALPIARFETFLQDLHNGPAQEAATVKLALVVWRQAVERSDADVACEMLSAAIQAVDHLANQLTVLLATGRQWVDEGADT